MLRVAVLAGRRGDGLCAVAGPDQIE